MPRPGPARAAGDGRTARSARAWVIAAATVAATAAAGVQEVLQLPEGRVYRGEVRDGPPHGEGRMIWSSGAVHTGTWVDGARSGSGRLTWPDGRSYDGA